MWVSRRIILIQFWSVNISLLCNNSEWVKLQVLLSTSKRQICITMTKPDLQNGSGIEFSSVSPRPLSTRTHQWCDTSYISASFYQTCTSTKQAKIRIFAAQYNDFTLLISFTTNQGRVAISKFRQQLKEYFKKNASTWKL